MRIFFSQQSDPMLLDSLEGMKDTYRRLTDFLSSPQAELTVAAERTGSPAPHDVFLPGLRIKKGDGPIHLRLTDDGYLSLTGSLENLSRYISSFEFDSNGEGKHHHPDYVTQNGQPLRGYVAPSSMSLIIEIDSVRVADLKDES
jgi:hypothetical protein